MAQLEYGAYLNLINTFQFAKFANGIIDAIMSSYPVRLPQPTLGAGGHGRGRCHCGPRLWGDGCD